MSSATTPGDVVPWVLIVGGALFAAVGLAMITAAARRRRHRATRGTTTEGVVVDTVRRVAGEQLEHPVVEFVDAHGATRRFTGATGTFPPPRTGRRVTVWYDPSDAAARPALVRDRAGAVGRWGILLAGVLVLCLGVAIRL
ncbi:DUF3592 domain-containing protein [Puerhibacterium puerhi]|uniref:DUF3592 domain-containing protein n=1 Tax=Puerhibacterium puerhi TaxID=2692623 RepID=UPI00135940A6|nr:DUF3592 domain-containing protein [Puerhibacterium puerhi]